MLVCDRCGNKINEKTNKTLQNMTMYRAAGAYCCKTVDLCDQCLRERDTFIGRAESYFMTKTENPMDIFENVRYWNAGF